jgi:asparagine synthase (glutamine-hydrolysing)
MGAIFGFVGKGTLDDAMAMSDAMSHRGRYAHVWSPDEGVYLGERNHWSADRADDMPTVADLQLDLDWRKFPETAYATAAVRSATARQHLNARLRAAPESAPTTLFGQFSYAFWDSSTRTLFIACDRMCSRHVYYIELATRFAFATEYKALLALADCPAAPHPKAIQYYLASRRALLDETCLANVMPINRGRMLTLKDGHVRVTRYWQPTQLSQERTAAGHAEALRGQLLETVARQIKPYRRIGVTLSGGLDSPGLLGLVRKVSPDTEIATYTIGYGDGDPEIEGARIAASHFATEHHELNFDIESIPRMLPQLAWITEENVGREEALLQFKIERSMAAKEQVIVAGHGADVVFGGMPRHRLIRLGELVPFGMKPATEIYYQAFTGEPPVSLRGKLASFLIFRGSAMPPPRVIGGTGPTTVPDPVSLETFICQTIVDRDETNYHRPVQDLGQLEQLSPFLADDVIACGLSIPGRFKVDLRRQKIVLRDALAPLLPASILHRRKAIQRLKHDTRLSDILDGLADELLAPAVVQERRLIKLDYVDRIRRRRGAKAYGTDILYRLWTLIIFELWCRHFLDNRGCPWGFSVTDLTKLG